MTMRHIMKIENLKINTWLTCPKSSLLLVNWVPPYYYRCMARVLPLFLDIRKQAALPGVLTDNPHHFS